MACYMNDNVYTNTFTPREYQVELLEAAKEKNIVVCSSTSSAKMFIVVKLLQEMAADMRGALKQRALILLNEKNIPILRSHIELLTDLFVLSIMNKHELDIIVDEWERHLNEKHIVLCTADICVHLLAVNICDLERFKVVVIDEHLYGEKQNLINELMANYKALESSKPRMLGLATGLLGKNLHPERLEAEFQRLENMLDAQVETSSEMVTLLRLSCRPRERLVECTKFTPSELDDRLRDIIHSGIEFCNDNRFDPGEIYDEEFLEEFKKFPAPKEIPLEILSTLLKVVEDLGAWCADQVALSLLIRLEKLKVKIPYERHFLLMCMATTTLVHIRAICDDAFKDLSELEKIYKYSSPKVFRFLEVLKQFKPPGERPIIPDKPVEPVETAVTQKGKTKNRVPRRTYIQKSLEDILSILIFTNNRHIAKTVYNLLVILSQQHEDFWWVSALYLVEKVADPVNEPKEAEHEHKRQEDVLRRYRSHDCNIMVTTSVLESDCDLPKCNLVIRFDLPQSFFSYVQCKARARANEPHYVLFVEEGQFTSFVEKLAEYNEVENILLRKCPSLEPSKTEEAFADTFYCEPYQPLPEPGSPSITLNNSIALVNRYCAKLPSDTFTRLTPIWSEQKTDKGYICSIRLPINSPVKQVVTSPPMHSYLLARRMAAFMICRLLHQSGELDDNLQPIGKENFKANEEDWNNFPLEEADEILAMEDTEPRPGTTKRRQYYYKRIADSLLDCHPIPNQYAYFYKIVMKLICPLPEEQNTRGRRIYPPEESVQDFGILISKEIPKISVFSIFTRSGEVSVDIQLCSKEVLLSNDQIMKIREFVDYTFTSVLRLQRFLMTFDPDLSNNAYLIVPTTIGCDKETHIDWNFINLIHNNLNYLPKIIPEEDRINYKFDAEKYKDAVVMPWYRNQDQPQYFYVAEICTNLNPKSAFPGSEYATFEEYYLRKYGINIQNTEQCLLDVDHTSARLNFLTPRYVNRKGVALPTSSEETKKAKRENLEQKQILVPELCAIHPFPASLWRKAVCLPCILYRMNALLLADQIRQTVSLELGLGKDQLVQDFEWPALNFGWSLSDVLKKSKEDSNKQIEPSVENNTDVEVQKEEEEIETSKPDVDEAVEQKIEEVEGDDNEIEVLDSSDDSVAQDDETKANWIEIGTWTNDLMEPGDDGSTCNVRYASPTSWLCHDMSDEDDDFSDSESCDMDESESELGRFRIEFMGDTAEAHGDEPTEKETLQFHDTSSDVWSSEYTDAITEKLKTEFYEACKRNKKHILSSEILVKRSDPFQRYTKNQTCGNATSELTVLDSNLINIALNSNTFPPIEGSSDEYTNEYDKMETLTFSFDHQPNLEEHPGPSPSVLLQSVTMSNANDGINLERLETIGDSFLKYAITNYLYSKYENVHEGKLSHLRSKQVSNLNLYRLGKRKNLGEYMIATKFDPHDNWLPPCFFVPKKYEEDLIHPQNPDVYWTEMDKEAVNDKTEEKHSISASNEKTENENTTTTTENAENGKISSITNEKTENESSTEALKEKTDNKNITEATNETSMFESNIEPRYQENENSYATANEKIEDESSTKTSNVKTNNKKISEATNEVTVFESNIEAIYEQNKNCSSSTNEKTENESSTELGTEATNDASVFECNIKPSYQENENSYEDGSSIKTSNVKTNNKKSSEATNEAAVFESNIEAIYEQNKNCSATTNEKTENESSTDVCIETANAAPVFECNIKPRYQENENSNATTNEKIENESSTETSNVKTNNKRSSEATNEAAVFESNIEAIYEQNKNCSATTNEKTENQSSTEATNEAPVFECSIEATCEENENSSATTNEKNESSTEGLDEKTDNKKSSKTTNEATVHESNIEARYEENKNNSATTNEKTVNVKSTEASDGKTVNKKSTKATNEATVPKSNTEVRYEENENSTEASDEKTDIKKITEATNEANVYKSNTEVKYEENENSTETANIKTENVTESTIQITDNGNNTKVTNINQTNTKVENEENGDDSCTEATNGKTENENCTETTNEINKNDIEVINEKTENENSTAATEDTAITPVPSQIPYNLVTQHSIPDKSIADCVEALIGAYLIECGPRGALLFMAWLGIRVLPKLEDGTYGKIPLPKTPLLRNVSDPEGELEMLLDGFSEFERHIGYKFRDRSYLLQALTHASYFPNKLTDCYQRLEFLGDAVLDYLITRHLYEDRRMHSPGALTDLRSALVNNTIFASLAVRNGFHRYFRHLSPGLNEVIENFIRLQQESGHSIVDELYLIVENDSEEVEDVEVPKALGDIFESVAGAIFLDSGMCLDAVWKVYHAMMHNEIEQFSNKVPKSPIRELLELEPETAKFGKPEKLTDGRRVRVAVEVFGKGTFKGIGRNYRIAKCTAAKCALKQLKGRNSNKQNHC